MILKNISMKVVDVMFDGSRLYFEPGEQKMFADNIAQTILAEKESSGLVNVDEIPEVKEEVVPVEMPKKKAKK